MCKWTENYFAKKQKKVLITLCDPQECKNKNQFPFTVYLVLPKLLEISKEGSIYFSDIL